MAAKDIYVDHFSGAKASRPAFDTVPRMLRDADTLKIARLDRLGRSILRLVTLGADLRERGVGLHVTEQVLRRGLTRPPDERTCETLRSSAAPQLRSSAAPQSTRPLTG